MLLVNNNISRRDTIVLALLAGGRYEGSNLDWVFELADRYEARMLADDLVTDTKKREAELDYEARKAGITREYMDKFQASAQGVLAPNGR